MWNSFKSTDHKHFKFWKFKFIWKSNTQIRLRIIFGKNSLKKSLDKSQIPKNSSYISRNSDICQKTHSHFSTEHFSRQIFHHTLKCPCQVHNSIRPLSQQFVKSATFLNHHTSQNNFEMALLKPTYSNFNLANSPASIKISSRSYL